MVVSGWARQFCATNLLAFLGASTSFADSFPGPYFGEVVGIVDGDNFEARIDIWPTISATVSVRIRGIDAPEIFRPECEEERENAKKAKAVLEKLIPIGTSVRLEDVQADSFSGRVVATAYRQREERGRTLVELLLNRGVVVPWNVDEPKPVWCE